jgi:crotonobetainyl-CoA:carnitine CoA-transferase CaiB-like acyl-CoA transferase
MVTAGALDGVRVLEFGSGVAGSFAARLLGDFGADVVKVERPGAGGRPVSALFEYLNWNKRGVCLDLADPGNADTVHALADWADIVISALRPGRLDSWGLGADQLQRWNPALTVTLISNFGQHGPQRDWSASDLIFQAMGGVAQISGTVGQPPLKPGLRQSLYCAGLNAAYVSLAGYLSADGRGGAPVIDLSILECVASQMVMNEPYYAFVGAVQGRRPALQDPLGGVPLPVADGFVSLQTNSFTPASRLAELLGDPRIAEPAFATPAARVRHAAWVRAVLHEHLRGMSGRELFSQMCAQGFLAGVVQGAEQLLSCPQLASRRVYRDVDDFAGTGARLRFPARIVEMSATPTSVRRGAPELGEHTEEVLAQARAASPRTVPQADPPDQAEGAGGPLAGLRVLDLSTVFAVPYIGALLADLGADVTKIESPRRLDQTRSPASLFEICFNNDPGEEYWNRTVTFQVLNRGKKAIALDLASEPGREVLRELIRDADVIMDNFTPRVMRGWGMTFEQLRAINPRLIMLSNTGYGSSGPWSPFKAQGTTLEATMGMNHYTGYRGGEPAKAGQSAPDFPACWTGLLALLAALAHRRRTGLGQWIDVGMYQLGVALLPEALLHYQLTGRDLPRRGNEDLGALLSGIFPARGADRWLAVSVPDRDQLASLAGVVPGVADILAADPAAGPADDNDTGDDVIARCTEAIAAWSAGLDARAASATLQAAGIAAGPVRDARDLLTDEQLSARGFYEQVDFGPELGARPLIGRPYRWGGQYGAEVRIRRRAPRYAERNDEVLGRLPGMSAARLAELRRDGVIVDRPADPAPASPVPLEEQLASGAITALDAGYVEVLRTAVPRERRAGAAGPAPAAGAAEPEPESEAEPVADAGAR